MRWLYRKPSYSQEEVAEQIGQISDLMKMRDEANPEEKKRFTAAVEVSQEVLAFMLDENISGFKAKGVV
jgi:hypothetical protein